MNPAGAMPPLRLPDPKALSSVLGAEQEVGNGQPSASLLPHGGHSLLQTSLTGLGA